MKGQLLKQEQGHNPERLEVRGQGCAEVSKEEDVRFKGTKRKLAAKRRRWEKVQSRELPGPPLKSSEGS